MVKLLLDKGVDISVTDTSRRISLELVASSGYLKVVRLLLDKEVDISVADTNR